MTGASETRPCVRLQPPAPPPPVGSLLTRQGKAMHSLLLPAFCNFRPPPLPLNTHCPWATPSGLSSTHRSHLCLLISQSTQTLFQVFTPFFVFPCFLLFLSGPSSNPTYWEIAVTYGETASQTSKCTSLSDTNHLFIHALCTEPLLSSEPCPGHQEDSSKHERCQPCPHPRAYSPWRRGKQIPRCSKSPQWRDLGLCKWNYSLTVKELKLHSALWRRPRGWCGPQWKWVWHPWPRTWHALNTHLWNLQVKLQMGS